MMVWSQHNKKLKHHRLSLFNRNGGDMLRKKLSKRKRSHLRIYTAEEMKTATNNYSTTDSRSALQRCNNRGRFYRAAVENREVAVMKIPEAVPESQVEQFVEELIFLSQPHKNVVRVSGCCLETSLPLVVYELHGDPDCIHTTTAILPQFCNVVDRSSDSDKRSVYGCWARWAAK